MTILLGALGTRGPPRTTTRHVWVRRPVRLDPAPALTTSRSFEFPKARGTEVPSPREELVAGCGVSYRQEQKSRSAPVDRGPEARPATCRSCLVGIPTRLVSRRAVRAPPGPRPRPRPPLPLSRPTCLTPG